MTISAPAWVLEGLPAGEALRRGMGLARGSTTKIFAAWCFKSAVSWVLATATSMLTFFVLRLIASSGVRFALFRALILMSGSVSWVLAGPIFLIAITVIYYDQRMRREGYDTQRMMEAAGLNLPAVTAVVTGDSSSRADGSAAAEVQPG